MSSLCPTSRWRIWGGWCTHEPCLQPNATLSFVLELDPTFHDVDELERSLVDVRLARELFSRRGPKDMGVNSARSCALDPQVSVLVEGAKASLKYGARRVGYDKALRSHRSCLQEVGDRRSAPVCGLTFEFSVFPGAVHSSERLGLAASSFGDLVARQRLRWRPLCLADRK